MSNVMVSYDESIVIRGEPGELKHLITQRKRKQKAIPKVVASEIGTAQTKLIINLGYGPRRSEVKLRRTIWKGRPKEVKVL